MNSIEDRYLDNEITKEEYNRMINRQKAQLDKLEDRRELLETPNRGKIEPQLKYSMSLIDNIDKFFKYAPADAKIRALSSIFSEKIEFDGKNFRTENLNSVLGLIYQQTNELRNPKKENGESFSTFPATVPYDILFSNKYLRDLGRIWELREIVPDPNNMPWIEKIDK